MWNFKKGIQSKWKEKMDTSLNLNSQKMLEKETKTAETAGTIAQTDAKPLFSIETAGTVANNDSGSSSQDGGFCAMA